MPRGTPVKQRREDKATARQSKSSISSALGMPRYKLDKFLLMPDAPEADRKGFYNFAEVIKWIELKKNGGEKLTAMQEAKLRKEVANARIAEAEAEQIEGNLVRKSEVAKVLVPLVVELQQLLRQIFELEFPSRYQGKDQVQCAEINAAGVDRIIKRFKEGNSKFDNKESDENKT